MGILLVYDVTDEKTFSNIRNWIRNIEQHATESVNKMLIGNKCDMEDEKVVDAARGKALADEYDIKFLETSAKTNHNVDLAFVTLAKDIKARTIDYPGPPNPNGKQNQSEGRIDPIVPLTTTSNTDKPCPC